MQIARKNYDLKGAFHRKVRKDRKGQPQLRTRMTQIKPMFTDPCKSAPSAKSAFYRRTDPRTKSTGGKVSAFICVHPRFFYDVTFQTGSTGWTGYDYYPFNRVPRDCFNGVVP
jgi:hypothetical protein